MTSDPIADIGFPPTPSHFGMPSWYPELLDSVTDRGSPPAGNERPPESTPSSS
jgi:hypothetical protein